MIEENSNAKFTFQSLNELGIFQLRTLARSIGVHLPTTMKKQELIEQILKVANGQIAPFVPTSKKGRPAKQIVEFKGSWSNQEETKVVVNSAFNSWELGKYLEPLLVSNFGVSSPCFEFNETDTTGAYNVEGIAFCEANGYVTLHVGGITKFNENNIVYISPQLAVDSVIRTGDTVQCLVNPKTKKACKVLSVNGAETGYACVFDKLEPIRPQPIVELFNKKELKFTKFLCPIGKGQRVLVRGERGSGKTELLKNMAEAFASVDMHTIFVSLDKRPEDKLFFDSKNIEFVFASFDTIPFRQMYMLELAVAKAKRMCEAKKDVVLIVDDLLAVARAYDFCLSKLNKTDYSGFDINTIIAIKKLLAVGKNVLNGGSITLIACIPCFGEVDDLRLVSMLDDVCNAHIILDKNLYQIGSKTYVSYRSKTDNETDLIDKSDIRKAYEIREKCNGKTEFEIEKIYQEFFD